MDGLKPYPAYRDSGVPWLEAVPSHWCVLPAFASLAQKLVRNSGMAETTVLSLSYGRIIVKPAEKMHGLVPESFDTYQIVDPDDIILRTTDLQNDQTSLRVGRVRHRGIITSAYLCLTAKENLSREYGHLLLNCYDLLKVFYGYGSGLRQNLDFGHIKRMPLVTPPCSEQVAIVRFLHYVDRQIQRYIRTKKKLVALLNEEKQAIINRAVTRGLDPDVRLKPSGIDWLGDVPEHWTRKRFKFVTRINSGQVDPRLPQYKDHILIAPNHIEVGTGRLLSQETASAQGADSGKYVAQPGQVIYSKIRPNLRKVTIAPTECLCSADMYPITPRAAELRAEYLLLLMLSEPFTKYTVDCSLRVAMPKVNRETLGNCWLWYPSLRDQDRIMNALGSLLPPLDDACSRAKRQIALMREYRTRLIADVVTGKLDVREAASNLPDEPDEDAEDIEEAAEPGEEEEQGLPMQGGEAEGEDG